MELTPTIVDIAVFGVILLSAIFAYARGLARESMTLLVWIGAALAALKFYPRVVPFIDEVANLGEWTKWAALAAAFVVALILLTIIGSFITRIIANSPLRAIDKGLGFLFGAARGIALLAVVWIGYQQLVEPEYSSPAIDESKGGQLVQDAANYLVTFVPDEMPPYLADAYQDFMGREIGGVVPTGTEDPAQNAPRLRDTTSG
jgi:membrane protein required for colicin V production